MAEAMLHLRNADGKLCGFVTVSDMPDVDGSDEITTAVIEAIKNTLADGQVTHRD